MTLLANVLLALVAVATYGGYAVYSHAHDDRADLLTLISQDLGAVATPSPVSAHSGDLLAYDAPDVPTGLSPEEYALYVARLNAQAEAYRATHPDVPTSTSQTAGSVPVRQAVQVSPSSAKPAPKPAPKAVIVAQTHAVAEVPVQIDANPAVASVTGPQQVSAPDQVVAVVPPEPAPIQAPTYVATDPAPIPEPAATPAPTPEPTPAPVVPSVQPATPAGRYRDGTYTGTSVDVFYGFVQVRAVVAGGNLTNVTFLSYPNDRRQSQQINSYAMPRLVQQAITAQSADVSGVSGATATSTGFRQSLANALAQA